MSGIFGLCAPACRVGRCRSGRALPEGPGQQRPILPMRHARRPRLPEPSGTECRCYSAPNTPPFAASQNGAALRLASHSKGRVAYIHREGRGRRPRLQDRLQRAWHGLAVAAIGDRGKRKATATGPRRDGVRAHASRFAASQSGAALRLAPHSTRRALDSVPVDPHPALGRRGHDAWLLAPLPRRFHNATHATRVRGRGPRRTRRTKPQEVRRP